ncbi:MAG TPA: IscS subfamily cysteine desulfurase [Bryobacteraceae bacterium]|jgi:cysteine desulfurase|nr:IscS subfamily cysteine desulfurase [Bryobacteraceae bacterium]
MKVPIYMDNHATTPVDPRVFEAMRPYFCEIYGNAASRNHSFGWQAADAVEKARKQVAELIGAAPKEIIFTSGATESDNLALKGVQAKHIITVVTEHKAVLDSCRRLGNVTYLPVRRDGLIDPDQLREAITDDTGLISVMYAHNEIGVVQDLRRIGAIARERGVLLHSDAAQAVGKIAIDVQRDNIDLLSISGHKIYGPKGVGALYARSRDPRVRLEAQMDGGGHERGMRSGTLNVAGIVGLGEACAIARREMAEESARLAGLRDLLKDRILAGLDGVSINGSMQRRLPNNLNLSFAGVEGEALLMGLNDVAVSSGSACTSATMEPSYVLKALGLVDDLAHSSIRFGLGRFNTREEVEYVAGRVIEVVKKLRELSPLYDLAR